MGKLQQIAESAGCSVSTVSKVLNNYQQPFSVNPELRARILAAKEKLDYRPNPYWRTLRSKKTNLIGVVTPPTVDMSGSEVAKWAFIETIRRRGYSEVVQYVGLQVPEGHLLDLPVDGACLFDLSGNCYEDRMHACEQQLQTRLENDAIPYVVINNPSPPSGISLLFDEASVMRLMLDHLWELGHRRIAYQNAWLGQGNRRHCSELEREQEYVAWMQAHGQAPMAEYDNLHLPAGDFLRTVVANGATAVVCYYAKGALQLFLAARELGLSMPGDLSMICVNDNLALPYLSPPMTCVTLPWVEMGETAGRLLTTILAGTDVSPGDEHRFAGKLVVRASTCSPMT